MPFDVQKAVIDFEYPKTVDIRSYKPSIQGNKLQIKRAVAAIRKERKSLLSVRAEVSLPQVR